MHSTTSHALPSSALMCGSGHIQSWCSSQIDSLFVCECKVTILLVGLENPHKNPRFEWHSTLHIYCIHFHVDYCVLCRTIIQHSNSWKRFAEFNHFWEKNAGWNFRISMKRQDARDFRLWSGDRCISVRASWYHCIIPSFWCENTIHAFLCRPFNYFLLGCRKYSESDSHFPTPPHETMNLEQSTRTGKSCVETFL